MAKSTSSGSPNRGLTINVKTAKKRSLASAVWLKRQLNDPYVAAAKAQGWRSRAAFKLIELDERFKLLDLGLRIVDLGAAPGGWTQVAVHRGAAKVIGLDLLPVDPVPGATMLQGDFNDPAMPDILMAHLGGKADLVMSDMAPNTTGHAATDHIRIVALAELAIDFALKVLELLERSTEWRDKLMASAQYFRAGLAGAGFAIPAGEHPITPLMLGDAALAHRMAAKMLEHSIYVIGFSSPVVPVGKARIRTQVSAAHSRDDLDRAIAAFSQVRRELQ